MIDKKNIERTSVKQVDETDCGVCCLLSLLRYYGGDNTIESIRRVSGTSRTGTTLLGLYQAANEIGFQAKGCESTIEGLIEYAKPVILHCLIDNNLEHFIVCYGYDGTAFVTFDPAKGITLYSPDELSKIWASHYCLTAEPTSRIEKKKDIGERKKVWLLSLIKEDYGILGVSIALGVIIALLGMATAVFSQKLIDELIPNKEYTKLWMGIVLLFLLLSARIGLSGIRSFLLYRQSRDFNNRIIGYFYNRLLSLPRAFFDTRKTGEMVARLNDTQRIQNVITNIAGDVIINMLSALVTLIFLFFYNWQIGLILTISTPFFFWFVYRYNKPIIDSQRNVMVSYAQSESNFINTIQGVETIRSLNRQDRFADINKAIYGRFQDNQFALGKLIVKLSIIAGIISVIALVSMIALGCHLIFSDVMKLGELMAVISLVSTIVPGLVSLALVAIPLNEAKVAFNRMFEFVNTPSESLEGEISPDSIDNISVRDIDFRFPGRKQLLRKVSMDFKCGEMSFIIGESGCGKTTLCHILERTYSPESGSIYINGNYNISTKALKDWRKHVGVMPQEVFIFNGTVLDNILLGIDVQQENMEEIAKKLSSWGFDQYIGMLPQGYMTIVGEEGVNLSGGQKQMIALIRLFLSNPDVMILDEPTSAMDREMEKFTLELLQTIKKDKIIIFVSHRLHILKRYADCISLIEEGKVVASGSHADLMLGKNMYSSYWNEFWG